MREPAFWWRARGWQAALLSPLGAIYGAVAGARMARPGAVVPVPVLCIGNLTLGGTGKTPAVIAVAKILAAAGHAPVILSRGYGGALAGPLAVDPPMHRAADVGDEPVLLARTARTVVAADRVAGARLALTLGAKSIVMDDGFQNPGLAKTASILVADGRRGIGNGCVFPAGPLRAPLAVQWPRAQAMLVIGKGDAGDALAAEAQTRGLRVFRGWLEPDASALSVLQRRPALAYAGIGDPEKFFSTLRDAGIDVRAQAPFPDHHRFSPQEAHDLLARAGRDDLALVSTEKDLARMAGDEGLSALRNATRALPVSLSVADDVAFRDFVLAAVAA